MSFADELTRFAEDTERKTHEVFVSTASAVHSSIVNGDLRTGAPGQPVDTGNLKSSFQLEFESPTVAKISTNVPYAQSIEDGVSYAHGETPLTLRSAVGGFHSVARTAANFDRILDDEVEKVASR